MALHWSTERLFLAAAAPALVSTVVMLAMGGTATLGSEDRTVGHTLRPHER